MAASFSQPLKGLLVVSMEQAVAAPYCASRLADAGARVIKIERAEGDFARAYDSVAKGQSSYFIWLNRGKESLCLDIKDPADKALLERLVAKADVFIQNLAPGAMARAGFGSATLREKHPRLITVDISGYGDEGDYATMKAYDLLVQAETGLAYVTGRAEGPGRVGVSACDIACGMHSYAAVLEALIERGITGRGKGIAVSLFDGMADWMTVPLLQYEGTGKNPPRIGLAHPSICPYGAFETKDGQLVLIAIQNEREWASFCAHFLDEPALPQTEGYRVNNERVANRPMVDAHIGRMFASLTREECAAKLRRANTAYGFVNDCEGLRNHPALRRVEVATPEGPVAIGAPPARLSDGPRSLGPVPSLGQHSAAIRAEFGG
ncbi:CoA transferase [Siccirubricoccus deserti]|uniref:CoA transferase n=1 Tax=Siccirubricoccus deserti TaxID=2013562 RepID=A0A9X0QZP6_9PROT|nr:CaiB/BaiF CoA-transferase family protein [Siccirubricoccus deserti]MBC4015843.1 CoA transferase [Siccirubricoccus deserti]GGC45080.1 CoA transferase [Siccirubricoccus deserti]